MIPVHVRDYHLAHAVRVGPDARHHVNRIHEPGDFPRGPLGGTGPGIHQGDLSALRLDGPDIVINRAVLVPSDVPQDDGHLADERTAVLRGVDLVLRLRPGRLGEGLAPVQPFRGGLNEDPRPHYRGPGLQGLLQEISSV